MKIILRARFYSGRSGGTVVFIRAFLGVPAGRTRTFHDNLERASSLRKQNGIVCEKPAKRRTDFAKMEDERSRSGITRKGVVAARAPNHDAYRTHLRTRAVALENRGSSHARREPPARDACRRLVTSLARALKR